MRAATRVHYALICFPPFKMAGLVIAQLCAFIMCSRNSCETSITRCTMPIEIEFVLFDNMTLYYDVVSHDTALLKNVSKVF